MHEKRSGDMYKFNCYNYCNGKIKCDGKSKNTYQFKSDVEFSEHYEKHIIDEIKKMGFYAEKTVRAQYPDIEVFDKKGGKMLCFIEVKVQRRTFMIVKKILPDANLVASETLALNLSDLRHYIEQSKVVDVPIYIMWVLLERPCILGDEEYKMYYNHIDQFKEILDKYGDKRTFRRKSGKGDVVNGVHKGVVVNYHFSIGELKPFDLNQILHS